jgi:hypothetical protein
MTTPKVTKTEETPSVEVFKTEPAKAENQEATFTETPEKVLPEVKPQKVTPAKPKPDVKTKEFKPVTSVKETENGNITHISTVHTINAKRG